MASDSDEDDEDDDDSGFPVDRPMEALKSDHHLLKQMFDSYLNAPDMNTRKEAARHALMLVDMHSSMEEAVFYSQVRQAAPDLVDRCEEDHGRARELVSQLDRMDEDDAQFEQTFRQLIDTVSRHIDFEEQQLFPKVEQANLDLHAIGLQMQEFESGVFEPGANDSNQTGLRQ
jgi:hemerythrin superfamily protein